MRYCSNIVAFGTSQQPILFLPIASMAYPGGGSPQVPLHQM